MILLTGGSGLLGTELRQYLDCYAPTSSELDITNLEQVNRYIANHHVTLIIHCAAYTDVTKAETEKELCYKINVLGTHNLVKQHLPMIHISTDGVFSGSKGMYKEDDYLDPVNYYSFTKTLAEQPVQTLERWAIIRTTFRPWPFQREGACVDKYFSADYVQIIGAMIIRFVSKFGTLDNGIYHVGGDRISVYNLARQSREVKPIKISDVTAVKLPKDTSLNINKWRQYG